MIALMLFIVSVCWGLFVAGLCLGRWTRSSSNPKMKAGNLADDVNLFHGWDGLTLVEQKKLLALYQQRVLIRSAEQEKAWLRARLRECMKE